MLERLAAADRLRVPGDAHHGPAGLDVAGVSRRHARRLAEGIAARLGERYAAYPALLMWHVSNPYGGMCCSRLCEIVWPQGAEVLATFGDDFSAGRPALTRNRVGQGQAYYIASGPEDACLDALYSRVSAHRVT